MAYFVSIALCFEAFPKNCQFNFTRRSSLWDELPTPSIEP